MLLKIASCIIINEPILLLLFLLLSLLLCSVNCLLWFVNKNVVISFSYRFHSQIVTSHHSLHYLSAGRVELPTKFSKKDEGVGLKRCQFLSGVCWENGVIFFRKVVNFTLKLNQNLKYLMKYLMAKKFKNKNTFSVIIKNLNWQF